MGGLPTMTRSQPHLPSRPTSLLLMGNHLQQIPLAPMLRLGPRVLLQAQVQVSKKACLLGMIQQITNVTLPISHKLNQVFESQPRCRQMLSANR